MKSSDLTQLIRRTVYECVNEILAQNYIQRVISESIKQTKVPQPKTETANKDTVKQTLRERLEMPNPYKEDAQPQQGDVSDKAMNALGVFDTDWSKFF